MGINIEVDKRDLISMVKGQTPGYDLFDDPIVKLCGSYNGSYGTWDWHTYRLLELKDSELLGLYNKLKNQYKNGQGN